MPVACLTSPMRGIARPALGLRLVAIAFVLPVFLPLGCTDGLLGPVNLVGSKANNDLAEGKIDPSIIERLVVYYYPPGLYRADHEEDLRRCRSMTIIDPQIIREFQEALAKDWPMRHDFDKAPHRKGTIMVVTYDKRRMYLDYDWCGRDARVEPPVFHQIRGYYRNGLVPWIMQYLYPQGNEATEAKASGTATQ